MTLYSIGHSNAEISAFLELLTRHGIELLVDTRRQPYSRYSPQFNRETLKASLGEAEIAYLFMGEQLGGRPQAAEFYLHNGKVDYERLAVTPFYLSGFERLLALAADCRLALFVIGGQEVHDIGCTDLRMRALGRKLLEKSKGASRTLTDRDFRRHGKEATYLAIGLS